MPSASLSRNSVHEHGRSVRTNSRIPRGQPSTTAPVRSSRRHGPRRWSRWAGSRPWRDLQCVLVDRLGVRHFDGYDSQRPCCASQNTSAWVPASEPLRSASAVFGGIPLRPGRRTAGSERSSATSARQSPPSTTASARSKRILPGRGRSAAPATARARRILAGQSHSQARAECQNPDDSGPQHVLAKGQATELESPRQGCTVVRSARG